MSGKWGGLCLEYPLRLRGGGVDSDGLSTAMHNNVGADRAPSSSSVRGMHLGFDPPPHMHASIRPHLSCSVSGAGEKHMRFRKLSSADCTVLYATALHCTRATLEGRAAAVRAGRHLQFLCADRSGSLA